MCMLAQHRGGTCFCTRDGVLIFSIRYKVVGICKNRDTIAGVPASAGQHMPQITNLSYSHKVVAACKPIAYTALLAFRANSLIVV